MPAYTWTESQLHHAVQHHVNNKLSVSALIVPFQVEKALAWSLVKTLNVYSSTSGANPGQAPSEPPITPATKVP